MIATLHIDVSGVCERVEFESAYTARGQCLTSNSDPKGASGESKTSNSTNVGYTEPPPAYQADEPLLREYIREIVGTVVAEFASVVASVDDETIVLHGHGQIRGQRIGWVGSTPHPCRYYA